MRDIIETLQTNLEIRVDLPSLISSKFVDEVLIGAIYDDLEGRVNREQIWQIACDVAERYHDASITTYIPIFIRRQTIEIMAS
jgi:hypothetical protein